MCETLYISTMSIIQQKGYKMAMIDEDDDIEALRIAALQTIRPRRNQFGHNGRFHRQNENPNLIAIVPQSENITNEFDPVKSSESSRLTSPLKSTFNVKDQLSSMQTLEFSTSSGNCTILVGETVEKKSGNHANTDKKQDHPKPNDSIDVTFEEKLDFEEEEDESEEDHDFVSLDDEDMSLEKLMDQMEQEFSQCNGKASKKSKTIKKPKSKSSGSKNKDVNKKASTSSDNKLKSSTTNTEGTSSSTQITSTESKSKPKRSESNEHKNKSLPDVSTSKSKVSEDVKTNLPVPARSKQFAKKSKSRSPIRYSRSPVRRRSPGRSPRWSPKGKRSPSPKYKRESPKRYKRSLTPRRKSLSPRRSPVRKYRGSPKRSPSPRRRRKSPTRTTSPVRKSPLRSRTPVRKSPLRAGSPSRRKSPKRLNSPLRRKSPYRHTSPASRKSPFRGASPRRKSPYRSLSPTRRKSPRRSSSPNKRKSPFRNYSPAKRKSPYRGGSPKRKSPYRGMSPSKRKSPFRHASPSYRKSPYRGSSPYKRKSPARGGSPGRKKSPFRAGSLSRYDGSPSRRKSPYNSSPPKRKSSRSKSPLRKSPVHSRGVSPRRKQSSPYLSTRQKKSPFRYDTQSRHRAISPSRAGSPHRTSTDSPRKKSPLRQSPIRKRAVSPSVKHTSPNRRPHSPAKSPVRRRRKSLSPPSQRSKYDASQPHVSRSKVSSSKKPRLSDPENEENLRSSRSKKFDQSKEINYEKSDPVLEARRRKFESNNLVGSLNKKIRLKPLSENEANSGTLKGSSIKKSEKSVSTIEEKVQSKDSKCDFSTQVTLGKELSDVKEMRVSKTTEAVKKEKGKIAKRLVKRKSSESEKEDILSRRKKIAVNIRPTAIQVLEEKSKRISERQQLLLDRERRKVLSEEELSKPERVSVMSDRWKSRSEQASISDKHVDEDLVDSKGPDLRAELSRRRAQRLKGIGSMGPTRLVQSALEGVVKKKDEEKMIMQADSLKPKKKTRVKALDLISSSSSVSVPKPRRVLLHQEHPTLQISDSEGSEESESSDDDPPVQKGQSILSRNQV